MAQSLWQQRRVRFVGSAGDQSWQSQRELPQTPDQSYRTAASILPNTSIAAKRHSNWSGVVEGNDAFAWTHGLPMEPFIIPNADLQSVLNGHLTYSDIMVGQSAAMGSEYGYGEGCAWPLPTASTLQQHTGAFPGSDIDTSRSTVSPKSYFSEALVDDAAANPPWSGYQPDSPGDVKLSPTSDVAPSILASSKNTCRARQYLTRDDLFVDDSLKQTVENSTNGGGCGGDDGINEAGGSNTLFRGNASDVPLWLSPEYINHSYRLPYYHNGMPASNSFQQTGNATAPSSGSRTHAEGYQTACDHRSGVRRHAAQQATLQIGPVADTQAQRKDEDDILLNGKAAGLTYKEIRKKIGSNVAESTLRGRYRSLTKARKDRVRKPIRLLKQAVNDELFHLDEVCSHYQDENQYLAKISWKKVAQYIFEQGGSYYFGNSTCKKKWMKLESIC